MTLNKIIKVFSFCVLMYVAVFMMYCIHESYYTNIHDTIALFVSSTIYIVLLVCYVASIIKWFLVAFVVLALLYLKQTQCPS